MKQNLTIAAVLLFTLAQSAWAQSVNYIKCSWNGSQVVTEALELADGEYATLNGGSSDNDTDLAAGTYVVKGSNVSYGSIYTQASSEVNIIICDGAKLTAHLHINKGGTLNIYAQSDRK